MLKTRSARLRAISLAVASVFSTPAISHAAIIADWTFETTKPTTAGPISPETGSGSASGSHAGAAAYSSPAGNGSSNSYSATTWAVGDYWQFTAPAANYQNISLMFDQTSSNTGPGNFQLEYSTNGSNFTNFSTAYTVNANASPNAWSSSTPVTGDTYTYNLSTITALNQATTVYFRLADSSTTSANAGTVASGGTDRVDNVIISGDAVVAPEPATIGLMAVSGIGFFFRRRRNR